MKTVKNIYTFVLFLSMLLFSSLAVLGNYLSENIGKAPDTVSVILTSLPFNDQGSVESWKLKSEANIFDFNDIENRDKFIKPGMGNSVVITIDNRNSFAFDYDIIFSFKSTPDGPEIPLKFKITRYDGKVLTDGYEGMYDLDGFKDSHTVGGIRYTTYLIEWVWPHTDNDTYFGDFAAEQELRVYMDINVASWQSTDIMNTNGDMINYNNNYLWTIVNILIGITPLIASIVGGTIAYKLGMNKIHLAGDLKTPKNLGIGPSGRKCNVKVSKELKYRYLKIRQYFDKNGRPKKDVINEPIIFKKPRKVNISVKSREK